LAPLGTARQFPIPSKHTTPYVLQKKPNSSQ
jgi:hypothetical protein